MISTSYIHEYAPHDQFMYESYYALLDCKDAELRLAAIEEEVSQKIFFGEDVESEQIYFEAEKENIFHKIGEAIISVFEAFINMLQNIGKSIKDEVTNIRGNATSEQMKQAMNRNPELASEFIQAVMSGNIKLHDIKDLNELLDHATEIEKSLEKGKLGTAADKAKEGLSKFAEVAKDVAIILGLVKTVTDISKNIDSMKDKKSPKKPQEITVHMASGDVLSDGNYFSESVNLGSVIKKVTDFLAERAKFCEDAISKVGAMKNRLKEKAANAKTSEEAATVNEGLGIIRQIFAKLGEELNKIKSLSEKVSKKLNKNTGGDK